MEVVQTSKVVGIQAGVPLYEYWLDQDAYQKLLECTHSGVPHAPNWHLTHEATNNGSVKHGSTVYIISSEPRHFYKTVYGDDFYPAKEEDLCP